MNQMTNVLSQYVFCCGLTSLRAFVTSTSVWGRVKLQIMLIFEFEFHLKVVEKLIMMSENVKMSSC